MAWAERTPVGESGAVFVPTAPVTDAGLRLGLPVRFTPVALRPVVAGLGIAGPALPVTHAGSVDAFLEVIDAAAAGSVLVIDNGGRDDEACIGDLIALEAQAAGIAGLIVWGRHRDTAELARIGLPVWSLGPHPSGPRRTPPAGPAMRSAVLGGTVVAAGDVIVADDDGVLVVHQTDWTAIERAAADIVRTETAQADRMRAGTNLRTQLDFAGYLARRETDPGMTLRRYLGERGGAIEV